MDYWRSGEQGKKSQLLIIIAYAQEKLYRSFKSSLLSLWGESHTNRCIIWAGFQIHLKNCCVAHSVNGHSAHDNTTTALRMCFGHLLVLSKSSGEHHDLTATSLNQNGWCSRTPWKPLASRFIYLALYSGLEIQLVFVPIAYILNEFVWPRRIPWCFQLICHLKFIFISAILNQEIVD